MSLETDFVVIGSTVAGLARFSQTRQTRCANDVLTEDKTSNQTPKTPNLAKAVLFGIEFSPFAD